MPCVSKAFFAFACGASAARQNLQSKTAASVRDAVGALMEAGVTGQSAAAFAKVMEGLSETPEAMDNLREALTGVVAELETNVETKIVSGFHDTQATINRRIIDVETTTSAAVQSKGNADKSDSTWIACVGVEKSKLEGVEEAEAALKTAQESTVVPCQQQIDRTPFSFEPQISTDFSCDFSKAGNCDAQLNAYKLQVEKETTNLDNSLQTASESYNEAKMACDAANADVAEKTTMLETARNGYNTQVLTCMEKHEARQLDMCAFGSNLQEKCRALSAYDSLITDVDQVNGNEYSQPDRDAEWETTRTTKCMLNAIIAGSDITDAKLAECKAASVFKTEVGELDRKADERAAQTTPENFTCDESTITFSGETWEIPTGAQPLSSDYKKVPYHPQVSTTEFTTPFSFCEPAGPGKR